MTDARIVKTRAALAQAVIALAGEKDFGAVTVSEIAQRAGIGYATFFRHYPDKESLLADVADALMDELLALMTPALLQEDTARASVTLCGFVDARRDICRALLAGGTAAMMREELVHRASKRALGLNLAQPEGLPGDLILVHAVTATLGLLAWWLEHGGGLDVPAMGSIIDRLVLRPVRGTENT